MEGRINMNSEIMVSILCIAYNHEPYIRNALDGCLMQKTDFGYEIIIHDDASTDNTAEIIREYEEKHPSIIKPIYQTENQYSKGAERILAAMQQHIMGKYTAYCECDDFWIDENKLRLQVAFLESNPEYAACSHNVIDFNCCRRKIDGFRHKNSVSDIDVIATDNELVSLASLVHKSDFSQDRPEIFNCGHIGIHYWVCINGKVRHMSRVMSLSRTLSSKGAWSSRVQENVNYRIEELFSVILFYETVIRFLNDECVRIAEIHMRNHKHLLFYALHEKALKKDNQKLLCADDDHFIGLNDEYKNYIMDLPLKKRFELVIRCKHKTLFSFLVYVLRSQWRNKMKLKKQWKMLVSKGLIPPEWADTKRKILLDGVK